MAVIVGEFGCVAFCINSLGAVAPGIVFVLFGMSLFVGGAECVMAFVTGVFGGATWPGDAGRMRVLSLILVAGLQAFRINLLDQTAPFVVLVYFGKVRIARQGAAVRVPAEVMVRLVRVQDAVDQAATVQVVLGGAAIHRLGADGAVWRVVPV